MITQGYSEPEYLGDAVYARFDGYHIWLYTHNGYGTTNEIALEPSVYAALTGYVGRLEEMAKEQFLAKEAST